MRTQTLSWASPLPPTRSGVADYAWEILPELVTRAKVRVIKPPGWAGGLPPWGKEARWVESESPPEGVELLHLGNNPYHLWVVKRLRRFGGVVVLHDAVLHHLLVEEAAADSDWTRFASELALAHGPGGEALARARRWGFSAPLDPFLFPARQVYLRYSHGVIVHSQWAAEQIRREFPQLPLRRVPLAVKSLPVGDAQGARRQLGVAEDELVVVHLGFLTPAKGLWEILKALAVLRQLKVAVKLLVVGEGVEDSPLRQAVRAMELGSAVQFTGYVSEGQLAVILAASDVGLVPRYPTAGETSAAVLRFLGAGRPVVVCGYQQFLELPPEIALRARPGTEGVLDMVRWLGFLAHNREVLAEKQHLAKKAWEAQGHAPHRAAHALLQAVCSLTEPHAREA